MAALTNWAGTVAFSTSLLERPRSVMELAALVSSTASLRALGTGHSFSPVADTAGTLVSVADLDTGGIIVDDATRTVSVPAGMQFAALSDGLHRQGWALGNLASLPHVSVAGACATGTHGSGDANPCIAATVVAIDFVDGTGTMRSLRLGDDGFGGAVLSLGALGITTRLTLRIEPTWEARQDVWLDLPWTALVADLDAIAGAGHSVSVLTTFADPAVADRLWIKSRGSSAVDAGRWGARRATEPQHPDGVHDPAATTEQLGRVGPWHERLPHFRVGATPSSGDEQQSEYLIDRRHAVAVLEALQAVGPELRPALEVCELRTVAADDLWLSPCHGRATLAVHATWVDDDALVAPALSALEQALVPFDPRPHWGKKFGLDADTVRAQYPRLPEFRDLVDRYDPERKFANAFCDRFLTPAP